MEMWKFYTIIEDKPMELLDSLPPFSIEVGTTDCWTCGSPRSNIARYGRLSRRMLLDESVLRFNLQANQKYAVLSDELSRQVQLLLQEKATRQVMLEHHTLVSGRRYTIVNVLKIIMLRTNRDRWQTLFGLRSEINNHRMQIEIGERDYAEISNMLKSKTKFQKKRGNAGIYDEVPQSHCYLQALGLELRLDIILIAEFLSPAHLLNTDHMRLELDLKNFMDECQELAASAKRAGRHWNPQQVEAQIFLIQLCALGRLHTSPDKAQSYLELGNAAIINTRTLLWQLPAREFTNELNNAEKMLEGKSSRPLLPSDERLADIWALEPPIWET